MTEWAAHTIWGYAILLSYILPSFMEHRRKEFGGERENKGEKHGQDTD